MTIHILMNATPEPTATATNTTKPRRLLKNGWQLAKGSLMKNNVISIRSNSDGQVPTEDSVFFTKDQIKVGSELLYVGRHDPGVIWRVTAIYSFSTVNGQLRSRKVQTVQKLADEVQLVCVGRTKGRFLELSFQYLSYSAIWRIKP